MAGASIGSAVPVLGTAIGFVAGVTFTLAFDWVYDNKEKITEGLLNFAEGAVETVSNLTESIGDAMSGVFDGIGSLFG